MSVKLLTERHLEFLSLKEAAQARLSLHLSKYHICWKSHVATQMFSVHEIGYRFCRRAAKARTILRFLRRLSRAFAAHVVIKKVSDKKCSYVTSLGSCIHV